MSRSMSGKGERGLGSSVALSQPSTACVLDRLPYAAHACQVSPSVSVCARHPTPHRLHLTGRAACSNTQSAMRSVCSYQCSRLTNLATCMSKCGVCRSGVGCLRQGMRALMPAAGHKKGL